MERTTSTRSADKLIAVVNQQQLSVAWILEAHAHADHLSSTDDLKNKLGGKTAIGNNISIIQKTFKEVFNLGEEFITDGHDFDHLFTDGELFQFAEVVPITVPLIFSRYTDPDNRELIAVW